ncbi:chromo domain-like protein [Mycena olivaceomarginata]|nr:chromo domain-like protein [Mycena olivaceomarginata]
MRSPPTFNTGESVLCYTAPIIYAAKILKSATDEHSVNGGVHYFVHYKGWKKTWDEWVPQSRLLKDTEANRARAPRLKKDSCASVTTLDWTGARGTKRKRRVYTVDGGSPKPVASPNKMSSFANPTKSSAAKVVVAKTPARTKLASASGSPSTMKHTLARATSLFAARQHLSFTRTFTSPGGISSLQILASALEKLRMPPPERPNTSMGLSRHQLDGTLDKTPLALGVDARSVGMGRSGLQSAVAVSRASPSTSSVAAPSMAKAPPSANTAFSALKAG